MEQQQRSLIFTAAVGLIILAIIVGSIYYLVKFIQTRVSSSRQSPQASVETIVEVSPSPSEDVAIAGGQVIPVPSVGQPTQQDLTQLRTPTPRTSPAAQASPRAEESRGGIVVGDRKVFNGGSFQISYPKNWGLLACANSQNIELDPSSSADSKISCSYALKPVTVLVGDNSGCFGDSVTLGNIQTAKSVQSEGGYIKYQWCTKTTPLLNITHRVSSGNDPASTREDYSKQIEEMISKLTFPRGS